MFPFIFEWVWDTTHIVFMGSLWTALSIISLGVGYSIIKALIQCVKKDDDTAHRTEHTG